MAETPQNDETNNQQQAEQENAKQENAAPEENKGVKLDEFDTPQTPGQKQPSGEQTDSGLEAVYDIPVRVSAVLGETHMEINKLLKLGRGAVVVLDRKIGEAIDIYVNDRLVARGEVVIADEDKLGVTMTEIVKLPK